MKLEQSSGIEALTNGHTTAIKTENVCRQDGFERWKRPSEMELARLAAQLARTEKIDPKQLVAEAWSIYRESCQRIEQDQRESERAQAIAVEKAREKETQIPEPEKYPVTFAEIELLLLPKLKGRTAERAELFREHIFAEMVNRQADRNEESSYWDCSPSVLEEMRDQARDMVSREFAELRAAKYHANDYMQFARSFLSWYGGYSELRNSEAKAANALKGWEKRRTAKTRKTGARPKTSLLKRIIEGK